MNTLMVLLALGFVNPAAPASARDRHDHAFVEIPDPGDGKAAAQAEQSDVHAEVNTISGQLVNKPVLTQGEIAQFQLKTQSLINIIELQRAFTKNYLDAEKTIINNVSN